LEIRRDVSLTAEERDSALRVLRTPHLLQSCVLAIDDPDLGVMSTRIRRRVRRVVLRSRGSAPRTARRLWFDLDCNLYRAFLRKNDRHFRGAWIAITGLDPRQRIYVPLAGDGVREFESRTSIPTSGPTIRVVIGPRVTLFLLAHVPVKPRSEGPAGGIDKGFTTLLTLSTGDPATAVSYGSGAGAAISKVSDAALSTMKQRRRISAHERSLRNSEPGRAKRMRRRNLGSTRRQRRVERDRSALRQHVDQSLNVLFREQQVLSRLYCEDLTFRATSTATSLNRRLARWLKGYLHQRLTYKAELNGVELTVVNAAYTSQSCPLCWFPSRSNRRGERFECSECGCTGSADAIAATNVLRRGSDPVITRFTSPGDVKHILEARWRSARNGRARGSNETVPALGVLRGTDGGQSREQPASRQPRPTSPHGGALSMALLGDTDRGPAA
jgi:IS605 OrfB family transposase